MGSPLSRYILYCISLLRTWLRCCREPFKNPFFSPFPFVLVFFFDSLDSGINFFSSSHTFYSSSKLIEEENALDVRLSTVWEAAPPSLSGGLRDLSSGSGFEEARILWFSGSNSNTVLTLPGDFMSLGVLEFLSRDFFRLRLVELREAGRDPSTTPCDLRVRTCFSTSLWI